MDKLIYKTLLACCTLVFVAALSSRAEEPSSAMLPVVISTGQLNGSYWSAGERLQKIAGEMRLDVELLPGDGSLGNIEKLLREFSPVNLAFVQQDVLQYYLGSHPEEKRRLEVVEKLGDRCVFIVTGLSSDIRTDEDLEDAQHLRLAVASDLIPTFGYMVSQIPEMKDIQVVYTDAQTVMDQLYTPESPVDAVLMVSRPREQTAAVHQAVTNPHRYRIVSLRDDRLNQKLPDGRKIYRRLKLSLPGADAPIETVCTRGLLLANKQKLSVLQRNKLTDLVNFHWMNVYADP